MANDQKNVDLVIRAQDQGKATLDGVAKSIKIITESLLAQVEAAKSGIIKSGELRDTLTQLQRIQGELSRQQGLIKFYEDLGIKLDAAKQKAISASQAYATAAATLAKTADPTAKQTAALAKLEAAQTRANAGVEKINANMATQAGRLGAAGIEINDLASAMSKITTTAEQTGAAIAVTDEALVNYNKNLRLTREAAEATARAETAAAAQRQLAAEQTALAEREAAAAALKVQKDAAEQQAFRTQLTVAERKRYENEYTTWWRNELEKREAAEKLAADQAKTIAEQRAAAEKVAAEQIAASRKAALEQAAAAQKRYDTALKEFNETMGRTNSGSRESLSWYQRVRGEVIALATAYVGFMGTIGLAKSSIDAFVQKQAAENRLAIVVGNDQVAIAKEWDYVHAQAERLGIGIKELADSYSSFAIAAKNGNLTLDQTKYAFERITEVMRVNHASSEAIAGSFVQLEQMLSKNKVQMDDLRQASTWIPGLEGMMARGLGMVNVEQLFAQMKKGAVDAKAAVLSLAEEMERQYAERLPDALKSLQAEQGRFNTSVNDFQRLIATSGFAEAYTTLLQNLSKFFKSTDGQKFAKDVSDAFSEIVKGLGGLQGAASAIESLIRLAVDLLKILSAVTDQGKLLGDILEIAIGVKIFNSLRSLVSGLELASIKMTELRLAAAAAGPQIEAAAVATSLLTKALSAVQWVLSAVAAFALGWEIGTILREKFHTIRDAADISVTWLIYSFKIGLLQIEQMFESLTDKAGRALRQIGRETQKIGLMQEGVPAEVQAQGLKEIAAAEAADSPAAASKKREDQISALKSDRDSLIASIRSGSYYQESNTGAAPPLTAQQKDALEYINQRQKELNGILAQRQVLLDAIREKWKSQQITQQEAESQASKAFASFGPRLKALQGGTIKGGDVFGTNMPTDEWQSLMSRMSAATGVYDPNLRPNTDKLAKQQETLSESLARQLSALNAQIDKNDQDANKSYETLLEERVKATAAAYSKINQDIQRFQKIGGSSIVDVDGSRVAVSDLKDRLATMQAQRAVQAQQQLATQQLAKDEQALNDAIKERSDRFKEVTDQIADGTITAAQGFKQIQDISGPLSDRINQMATAAQKFSASIRGSGAVSDVKLDAFDAKSSRAASSTGISPSSAAGRAGVEAYKGQEKELNDLLSQRNELVQTYNSLVKEGVLTQDEAQKKIQEAYTETRPAIEADIGALNQALEQLKETGAITITTFDELQAKLGLVGAQVSVLDPRFVKLKTTIENDFAQGVNNAFQSIADNIGALIDHTESWGDAWRNLGNIVLKFFADLLRQIASALIQEQALIIVKQIARAFHSGGVVGDGGSGAAREVSPSWFAAAPRYHDGAIVGLRPDEQAAILKKGEEVLTQDDPRNAMNGGRAAPRGREAAPGQRIVNVLHPDLFQDYMNSSQGEEVHLNVIRRNASSVKQILQEA